MSQLPEPLRRALRFVRRHRVACATAAAVVVVGAVVALIVLLPAGAKPLVKANASATPKPSASALPTPATTSSAPASAAPEAAPAPTQPPAPKIDDVTLTDPGTGADSCAVFSKLLELNAQMAQVSEASAQSRYTDLLRLTQSAFAKLAEVDTEAAARPAWAQVAADAGAAADALAVFNGDAFNQSTVEALGKLRTDYDAAIGTYAASIQQRCSVDLAPLVMGTQQ